MNIVFQPFVFLQPSRPAERQWPGLPLVSRLLAGDQPARQQQLRRTKRLDEVWSRRWVCSRYFKTKTAREECWPPCLPLCSNGAPVVYHEHVRICNAHVGAYFIRIRTYLYFTVDSGSSINSRGTPLSPGWVMAASPAWCHWPYFRVGECEGERQAGGRMFERMVLSSESWRTDAAWLVQMWTPWLYIISPSLGRQTAWFLFPLLSLHLVQQAHAC